MKIKVLILSFLFLFSQVVYAETKCSTCQIAIIKKGMQTPFDGYLYNNDANADMLARLRFQEENFKLKLEFELDEQRLRLNYDTATTAIALLACNAAKKEKITNKDKEIDLLNNALKKAEDKSPNRELWFSIGVGAGIFATILSIWGLSKLQKSIEQ